MSSKPLLKNDKGVSFFEFMIALPLVLIILGGIIDIGILLKNRQILADAVRHAGFTASQLANNTTACTGLLNLQTPCNNAPLNPSPTDPRQIATVEACNFLNQNGLQKADFQVNASTSTIISGSPSGASFIKPRINLTLQLIPGKSACFLCTTQYINTNFLDWRMLTENATYSLSGFCNPAPIAAP